MCWLVSMRGEVMVFHERHLLSNLSKVVNLSDSDRSFFAQLRLSQRDVQKLRTVAQARFQEYLQTVAPEIREIASDEKLLEVWQRKHLCAMVKEGVSLPKTPLHKEIAVDASFSPEKVSGKLDTGPASSSSSISGRTSESSKP